MFKRIRKAASIYCGVALAVVTALSLVGCGGKTPASPQTTAEPVRVETVRPTRENLKRFSDSTPAELLPYEQTDIVAKVAGYVQKVNVDIGDRVEGPRYTPDGRLLKQGQTLAELWMPEMVEELKQK